jgi:hypothetical protein
MRVKSSIERGAEYLCTKLGDVVTAIEQVAMVKGLAMWEVERKIGEGIKRRLIVSERSLRPLQLSSAGALS